MSSLIIGKLDNKPVVKILHNDDDPVTAPDADFTKFRFNSNYRTQVYSKHVPSVDLTLAAYNTWYHYPPGTDITDCKIRYRKIATATTGGTYYTLQLEYYLDDYGLLHNAPLALQVKEIGETYVCNSITGIWYPPALIPTWVSSVNLDLSPGPYRPVNVSTSFTFPELFTGRIKNSAISGRIKLDYLFTQVGTPIPEPFSTVPFLLLDVPINDQTYQQRPETTPVDGDEYFKVDPSTSKFSSLGYDVNTALDNQLIFGPNRLPVRVAGAKEVTVPVSGNVTQQLSGPVFGKYALMTQCRHIGSADIISPLWTPYNPEVTASDLEEITATVNTVDGVSSITLENNGNHDVLVTYYVIVVPDDTTADGNNHEFSSTQESSRIVAPDAPNPPKQKDIILDSRYASLMVLDTDATDPSTWNITGTYKSIRNKVVSFDDYGVIPLSWACWEGHLPNDATSLGYFSENITYFGNATYDCQFDYQTLYSELATDQVTFHSGFGNVAIRWDTVYQYYYLHPTPYWVTNYIRHFVFGVVDNL